MIPTNAFATSNNEFDSQLQNNWFEQLLSFLFGKDNSANLVDGDSYYGYDYDTIGKTYKENDKEGKDKSNDKDKDKNKDQYDSKDLDKWKDKDEWWKKTHDDKAKESIDIWRDWYCFPGLGWGVDGLPAEKRGHFPGEGDTDGYFPGIGPTHDHRP
jgi:hypothetical protein